MSTLTKHTVQTDFKSTGSRKVAAETQSLGSGFRQLGDNSAGAARGFGSMQKGLGGLVGAYAGAAATFFALQQAFSALREAAKLEQSIQGTKTLAASIGQNGDKLLLSIQKITKGQLTLKDASESANLALASGFNTEQIEKLSSIATKASRALGRDLGDSFIRLVRGTAKLEPELLDELGIFTRIEPAVRAYAASLGKSEKFLTNFERRQAFANAVAEEGARKYATIGTSSDSSVSSLERLTASLVDLGQTLTGVLANGLAPVAEFLSGSLANSFAAIGLIASLAFSKLFQMMTAGLKQASQNLDSLHDKIQLRLRQSPKAEGALLGLRKVAIGYSSKDSYAKPEKGLLSDVVKEDVKNSTINKYRDFVTQESALVAKHLANSQAFVGASQRIDAAIDYKALSKFKDTKKVGNVPASSALSDAIRQQLKAGGVKIDESNARAGAGVLNVKETNKLVKAVKANLMIQPQVTAMAGYDAQQTKVSKGINAIATGAQIAGKSIIRVFETVTSVISKTLFWLSAFEIAISLVRSIWGGDNVFDNMLETVKDLGAEMLGLTENAKNFKKALADIGSISLDRQFKALNLNDTDKFDFEKRFAGVVPYTKAKDIDSMQKDVTSALKDAYDSMKSSFDLEKGTLLQSVDKQFMASNFSASLGRRIDELREETPLTYAAAAAQQALINTLKELQAVGPGAYDVLKNLAIQFGVSAQQFEKSFDLSNFKRDEFKTTYAFASDRMGMQELSLRTPEGLKQAREALKTDSANMSSYLSESTRGRMKGRMEDRLDPKKYEASVVTMNLMEDLTKATMATKAFGVTLDEVLYNPNINADGLSQTIQALTNVRKKYQDIENSLSKRNLTKKQLKELDIIREHNRLLSIKGKELDKIAAKAQFQLVLGNQITKTFQSEISAAQEFSGIVNSDGSLAMNAQEERATMMRTLSNVITQGEAPGALGPAIQNANTAKNVLLGTYIKTAQELKKINQELAKDLIKIEEEKDIAISNLYIAYQKNIINQAQIRINVLKATFDYENKLLDIESKLNDVRTKAAVTALQTQINILNTTKELLTEEDKLLQIQLKRADVAADRKFANDTAGLQFQSDLESDVGNNLSSDLTKQNREFTLKIADLDKMVDAIDRDIKYQIEASDIKQKQLDLDAKIAEKQYKIAVTQAAGESAKINIEIQKLNLQKQLAQDENASKLAILASQRKIADEEKERTIAKIEADRLLRKHEIDLMRERINLLNSEAEALKDHATALAEILSKQIAYYAINSDGPLDPNMQAAVDALPASATQADLVNAAAKTVQVDVFGNINKIKKMAEDALGKLSEYERKSNEVADLNKKRAILEWTTRKETLSAEERAYNEDLRRADIIDQKNRSYYEAEKAAAGANVAQARQAYEDTLKIIETKKFSTKQELDAALEKATFDKENLDRQKATALELKRLNNNSLFRFANESISIVKDNVTKGLQDLNAAFMEGTLTWENFGEGAKAFAYKLVTDIQASLVNKTIIEPVTSFIQNTLGSLTKSIFDVGKNPARPMYVWDVNPKSGLPGGLTSDSVSGGGGLLSGIGDFFGNMFGDGMASGSALSGLEGQALSNIAGGAAGMSSGGSVKRMAAGGQAGRDTIPAWLEPGEFVMRRSAVDNVGLQGMQRINNGGNTSGDVAVNVINHGTPQEVQGKPSVKFDAEKMVIDIVLKDFGKNGPIRQTLRGNSF